MKALFTGLTFGPLIATALFVQSANTAPRMSRRGRKPFTSAMSGLGSTSNEKNGLWVELEIA
jgi:hypothetical protein